MLVERNVPPHIAAVAGDDQSRMHFALEPDAGRLHERDCDLLAAAANADVQGRIVKRQPIANRQTAAPGGAFVLRLGEVIPSLAGWFWGSVS